MLFCVAGSSLKNMLSSFRSRLLLELELLLLAVLFCFALLVVTWSFNWTTALGTINYAQEGNWVIDQPHYLYFSMIFVCLFFKNMLNVKGAHTFFQRRFQMWKEILLRRRIGVFDSAIRQVQTCSISNRSLSSTIQECNCYLGPLQCTFYKMFYLFYSFILLDDCMPILVFCLLIKFLYLPVCLLMFL